ncbi:MAG TPA: DNA primase [Steroidobacteraceae bacterium]
MSQRIPQHFIDELIARVDLVELVGSRVPLKKQGKEFKACCPFHTEKTPSFSVVPEKQFYHCFGCGAHGTALGFLMEYDHLSFLEAVEELATRVGLEVPRDEQQSRGTRSHGLFEMLEKAAELYRRELKSSERAKDYFKKRGITGETAARFGLGYAPDAWDFLLKHLGASESDRQALFQAGLIIERDRRYGGTGSPGYYDRFRDRVMFPIRDARGRTIGFGGRVIDKGDPKYMNSPETELFHKGRELYGLYEARQASRTLNRLLIVEGYMDVVRLHQAGITYAVATLGTATTPEHLSRVFRICNEVIFCFDGDRAGRAAAWRALENALGQIRDGRQIRFLFLPEGHDPDSLVGAEGREAFETRLTEAMPLSAYFLDHLGGQVDMQSVDGRARLAELAKPLLERIPAGVYRELLTEEVAKRVRLDPGRMTSALSIREPARPAERPSRNQSRPTQPDTVRGSLVRQAIRILVHHPTLGQRVTPPPQLAELDKPGVALLCELLTELRENPCPNTAVLLERWRDRPNLEPLAKLARTDYPLEPEAALSDLTGVLEKLEAERRRQRLDELLEKQRREALSDAERIELHGILSPAAAHPPAAGRRT